ncbi:hypothetical protein ACTA71_011569 [Dictyostelium dimigraforme]
MDNIIETDKISNSDNSFLFFKIWRNCVLKKIIFEHLMMFNLFSFPVDESLSQLKITTDNKKYIKSLLVRVDDIKKDFTSLKTFRVIKTLNDIPIDIESVLLYQDNDINYDFPNLKVIPKSLTKLHTHYNFNRQLSKENTAIFSNLTTLVFGFYFNQLINENILPNSLRILKFGFEYNQRINENVLPKSLERISFQNKFNQSLKYLPGSIKEIKFLYGSNFKQRINSSELPSSLTKLTLPGRYNLALINGVLPNKLLKLKISNLKSEITYDQYLNQANIILKVYKKNGHLSTNQEISNLLKLNSSIIPSSVTNLSIFSHFYYSTCKFNFLSSKFSSVNLNYLGNGSFYYEPPLNLIDRCERIKSLCLKSIDNNLTLDNHSKSCLSDLISLDLGNFNYNAYTTPVLDFKVFTKLKCLRIGNYKSRIYSTTLPPTLELLELGYGNNQLIENEWLPKSLKHLIVSSEKSQISFRNLPSSLESLWVPHYHYQLKYFDLVSLLIGKLNITDENLIKKAFNIIFKKKYEIDLY